MILALLSKHTVTEDASLTSLSQHVENKTSYLVRDIVQEDLKKKNIREVSKKISIKKIAKVFNSDNYQFSKLENSLCMQRIKKRLQFYLEKFDFGYNVDIKVRSSLHDFTMYLNVDDQLCIYTPPLYAKLSFSPIDVDEFNDAMSKIANSNIELKHAKPHYNIIVGLPYTSGLSPDIIETLNLYVYSTSRISDKVPLVIIGDIDDVNNGKISSLEIADSIQDALADKLNHDYEEIYSAVKDTFDDMFACLLQN